MRIRWIDIIRGVCVLSMISLQLLDAFKILNLYDTHQIFYWWGVVGWVIPFWLVSGYSSTLMLRKYGSKTFFKKTFYRFIKFSLVGYSLMFLVPFSIQYPSVEEAVASIGLCLMVISPLIALRNLKSLLIAVPSLFTVHYLIPLPFFFSPSLVSAFMLLGACFSYLRIKKDLKCKPLEWVGRHALKFYVAHFLIITIVNRI